VLKNREKPQFIALYLAAAAALKRREVPKMDFMHGVHKVTVFAGRFTRPQKTNSFIPVGKRSFSTDSENKFHSVFVSGKGMIK